MSIQTMIQKTRDLYPLPVPRFDMPENCPSKSERATPDLTPIHYTNSLIYVHVSSETVPQGKSTQFIEKYILRAAYNIPMSTYRCIVHRLRSIVSQAFETSRTKRVINAFIYGIFTYQSATA